MLIDRLTEKVRQESPWSMMFGHDIVICEKIKEQAEASLEKWRAALESRGLRSAEQRPSICV